MTLCCELWGLPFSHNGTLAQVILLSYKKKKKEKKVSISLCCWHIVVMSLFI